ncbi:uncharacterized protein LOC105209961 [Zeugodacus cucurbitae]|uniref:uncharacterized protein LOC105209961 n=1 Tax=Zeugodacus cucurbitae TaxID=28588 RepID=UPI0023D9484F|nr:uncharacterized protein LOC105209961 [Zeugodacus cucurbitae]
MNNKNPDPKASVKYTKTIQAIRLEIQKKKNKNEMAHDINNDKIKVYAIYQLILQLMHSIELTLFAADKRSPLQIALQMPHNAFMWTKEAWQERRNYGVYWMEFLMQATNQTWVEERKMQVGLRQLNDLALSILLSYTEQEQKQEAFKALRSVMEYDEVEEVLSTELIANTNEWNRSKEEKRSFDEDANTINILEQQFLRMNVNDLITEKIKERYTTRHNEVLEEQAELAAELRKNALIKQIDKYKERSENDAFIAAYKNDVYYNTIELLRIKLENMEMEFVAKDVETENNRQFLQTGIAKMKTNLIYMKEKLQLYRTAVQQFREGIITDFTALRFSIKSLALSHKSMAVSNKSLNTSKITWAAS